MFFMAGQVGFDPFRKFAPCKHDAPSTAFAFESDIRAETGHDPFVGTTGMLFAQAQVIVEMQIGEHGRGVLDTGNRNIEK